MVLECRTVMVEIRVGSALVDDDDDGIGVLWCAVKGAVHPG